MATTFVGVAGVPGQTTFSGTEPLAGSNNHGPLNTSENHVVHWGNIEHNMKRLTLANTIKLGGVDGTPSAGMLQWTGAVFQGNRHEDS